MIFPRLLLCLSLLTTSMLSLLASQSASASIPSAPGMLCVESSCANTSGGGGAGIKWHPGNYIWVGPIVKAKDAGGSTQLTSILSTIDSKICDDPNIEGVAVMFYWAGLEGSTAGDYSAGFAMVDQVLQHLSACSSPKRLWLRNTFAQYGSAWTSTPNCSSFAPAFPAYLCSQITAAPVGVLWSGQARAFANVWTSSVMDRLIALQAAYGKRYDSNSMIEVWDPEFTGGIDPSAGYSFSALTAQYLRLFAAAKQAWPTTQVRHSIDYYSNDATTRGLVDSTKDSGLMFGGTDSVPDSHRKIYINFVWRGCTTPSSGTACTPGSSWSDLRGKYSWVSEIESPDLPGGSFCGSCSLQDLQDYAHDTLHANYMLWYYNDWSGTSDGKWPAVKAFIDAGKSKPYSTACPAAFLSCNTK